MSALSEELKARTMSFAVAVLRAVDRFPLSSVGQIVGKQLARSATSQGANYRAACTARSRREFVARLGVVNEEVDECVYWLELADRLECRPQAEVTPLKREAFELRAIFGRSLATARRNLRKPASQAINEISR